MVYNDTIYFNFQKIYNINYFYKNMDNFKEETQNLFLEINPDLDEIVKEDVEMNEDADVSEIQQSVKQDKYTHNEVFEDEPAPKPKKRVIRKTDKKKVKFETPPPKPLTPKPIPKEDDYKPTSTREAKAIINEEFVIPEGGETLLPPTYREKKKLETAKRRAEEKAKKDEEKTKHREMMKEKNRQKARERYYKLKEQKEEKQKDIPKKIVETQNQKLNTFQKRELNTKLNKPNDMDFTTFTNYMLKYEELKSKFNKQKEDEEREKRKKENENKQVSPFPENYPSLLIYGNKRKKNNIFF